MSTAVQHATQPVSALDRFGFTLFMAVALHAVVIFGSHFSFDPPQPAPQTLEITLAQHPAETPPEDADFLAQTNQLASGTEEDAKLLSTTETSSFQDDRVRNQAATATPEPQVAPTPAPTPVTATAVAEQTAPQANTAPTPKPAVTTTAKKPEKLREKPKQPPKPKPAPSSGGASTSLLARSLEIANLQAQIEMQQQALAKRPKVRRLTAVSTKSYEDAIYMDNWRRRIVTVGNMNYPVDAHRKKLYGTLRVLVAILPDGSLKSVEVLQSSGHKALDDAAVRIVRLAAPFQPFTTEMKKNTDVLEIIRTWKFEKTTQLY